MNSLGIRLFGAEHADLIRPLAGVPLVVLSLGGSAIIHWRASKDWRVTCPHCGRILAGGSVRLVTVATSHCPLCGKLVINDDGMDPN